MNDWMNDWLTDLLTDLLTYLLTYLLTDLLASSISLDQTMCSVWKMLMLFVAKLGIFRIQQELSKSKSNLIPF